MKRLLLIVVMILTSVGVHAETIKIEVTGVGSSVSKHESLEIKKQEAFVSAFFVGVGDIVQTIYGANINSLLKMFKGKKESDKAVITSQGVIKDIEINSQTLLVNSKLIENIISCNYRNQKIVVRQNKLAFPPIDFLKFPSWENTPKTISEIAIKKIYWNKEAGDWICNVTLSYLYDPSLRKKKKKLEAKGLTFKYEKDNSGNIIYETITVDGTSYGGENDTPNIIRKSALKEALKNAVENVNGVYIQALSEVENAILTRDEIISQTLGIAKIVKKSFSPGFTAQGNYEITCTVSAKVPIIIVIPIE